jgi:hypothetical protein
MRYPVQVLLSAFFAVTLFAQSGARQSAPWNEVKADGPLAPLQPAVLTVARRQAIENLMRKNAGFGNTWECPPAEVTALIAHLQFHTIELRAGLDVLLIESGEGCARGGQGSNGGMWLVRFDGDKPSYLATPADDFNGWLYSIQPAESHGFRDIVLGWHMSASEYGLVYFRFDGKRYRAIGSATATVDDDTDKTTITPNKD